MPKCVIPIDAAKIENFSFTSYDKTHNLTKKANKINLKIPKFRTSLVSLLFGFNVLYFGVLVVRWNYFISRSVSYSFQNSKDFFKDNYITSLYVYGGWTVNRLIGQLYSIFDIVTKIKWLFLENLFIIFEWKYDINISKLNSI